MQNPTEKADININEATKKTWSAPFFEIISKDVVQNGSGSGPEASPSVAGS